MLSARTTRSPVTFRYGQNRIPRIVIAKLQDGTGTHLEASSTLRKYYHSSSFLSPHSDTPTAVSDAVRRKSPRRLRVLHSRVQWNDP